MKNVGNKQKLPEFFRPLFWSYNFKALDLEQNKKTIILAAINYGDLKHWRWLKNYYGKDKIINILENVPATALRPRVRKLTEILFKVRLNHASRGAD